MAVTVIGAPEQIVLAGEAVIVTFATADELTATVKLCVVPGQPTEFVSTTETVPLATPNVTVIEFVFVPAVMFAPAGTDHA